MTVDGRSSATETSDEMLCAVCHAAARDGADAVLLTLRQDNGSAWRLVQLDPLEGRCTKGMPSAAGRSAAAQMMAHAKADGVVVHDT